MSEKTAHGDRDVDTVCISCVLRKVFAMCRDGGGRARCHDQILTVGFESVDMRAIAPVCVWNDHTRGSNHVPQT